MDKNIKFCDPSDAAIGDVLWKKVFFKISQISRENNCAEVSF